MTNATPPIDILLQEFFRLKVGRAKPERRWRLHQIDKQLRRYLEDDVPARLCFECEALISAEREFNPHYAVARLLDASVLLCSLPGFLAPGHVSADSANRRTQFEVVRGLGRMLLNDGLVYEDDFNAFEDAVAHAAKVMRTMVASRNKERSASERNGSA